MVLQDIAELHFNSQPHKEADQIAPYARRQYYISTHSLTRRLTEFQEKYENAFANFNSQPHKEADLDTRLSRGSTIHFNSQPHKEADGPLLFDFLPP